MSNTLPAEAFEQLPSAAGHSAHHHLRLIADRTSTRSSAEASTPFLDPKFWRWFVAYWQCRAGSTNAYAKNKNIGGRVEWEALARSWGESDGRCCWCGTEIGLGVRRGELPLATVEHLLPFRDGGLNLIENIGWACKPCNEQH